MCAGVAGTRLGALRDAGLTALPSSTLSCAVPMRATNTLTVAYNFSTSQHLLFIFAQVSELYGHPIDNLGGNPLFKHSTFLFRNCKGFYPGSILSFLPLTSRGGPEHEGGLWPFFQEVVPSLAPGQSSLRPLSRGFTTRLVQEQQQQQPACPLSSAAIPSAGADYSLTRGLLKHRHLASSLVKGKGTTGCEVHC